jgi:hypothetical protein
MTSFSRKFKRKQQAGFMKQFKKTMKNFKKMVKCAKCDHRPQPGENIDDWHIDKNSEDIDLICTECYVDPSHLEDFPNV